jgi:NhaP-type Na+/H+ or K+/H+ antiporter
VAKGSLVLLSVVVASALARAQVPGGVLGGSEPDLKTAYVGSAVTCSQSYTIVVPRPLLERAKLKARLAALLRESLFDDAKGIVNMPREKEIRKLANKLRSGRED